MEGIVELSFVHGLLAGDRAGNSQNILNQQEQVVRLRII
ncbi:hypothetical protein EG68_07602 [Paragonimus skrjabini miyazakii]|uniref:Uncharacterized protein n=1 Tax=Paragonimus skrjabini miyazakii TaxID=59628 RepID=A0A8S9YL29_9TREM|nr:hypothetical protein EG68_07602 [Paragonimus skrjabini miyazakii]